MDLYLYYSVIKTPFSLNLMDRQTYGRTDISIHKVASLLMDVVILVSSLHIIIIIINTFLSNLGYMVFGALFMFLVFLKKWKYNSFLQQNRLKVIY